MPSPLWSDWQPLPGLPAFAPAVLAETLDGGQSFRWQQAGDGTWQGVWADCIARLRLAGTPHTGPLEWSAPAAMQARVAKALPVYLTGSSDFSALADTLPWRSDSHLARCLAAFPGLALPRQPFGETLLCFLCSATKQIVQIKQMVALLAARHGTPLLPTSGSMLHASVNRLPTWPALAAIPRPASAPVCSAFVPATSRPLRFISRPVPAGWMKPSNSPTSPPSGGCWNSPASVKKSPTACCSSGRAGSRRSRWIPGFSRH
jgi:hypothetical protein